MGFRRAIARMMLMVNALREKQLSDGTELCTEQMDVTLAMSPGWLVKFTEAQV